MISRAHLKYLRSLRLKKFRVQDGCFLVEGLHVVEEAVKAGRARELLLSDEVAAGPRGRALADAGLPVHGLAAADIKALAETRSPAGAFALVDDPCGPLDAPALPEHTLVLVAAGVADPGNLGTLVRTASALGAGAVVVTAGTVEPTNGKVVRATAGALFHIPVRFGEIADLKAAGFQVFVAAAAGRPVGEFRERPDRLALAVGNEPRGVADAIREQADAVVAVPQAAGVESLNVAVAAGILMHALGALPVAR